MRYFRATLVIGVISALLVLLLDWAGLIRTLEVTARTLLAGFAPTSVEAGWGVQVASVVVFALAAAWTTIDIGRPVLKTVVALAAVILLCTGSVVLALYGVYFAPFKSILAVAISFFIGLGYGRSDAGARKRVLQRLFGARIAKRKFIELVDADTPLDFAGAEQNGTVVVCEIHNHVELIETLEPADYVAMTNLYLQAASDFLVESGGYLDECGGESLRVVFGAPLPDATHAGAACRAALELIGRLEELNKEIDARWQKRLDYRVGVNSGPMIVAAYGGARLGSFSVAGPAVEFARRLCAACANYGCRILMGPETFELAGAGFELRPIEMLKRADKRRIELYELLAAKHGLSPERARSRDHFWKGVIYFRERKWDQALEEFGRARVPGIPDAVLDHYVLLTDRSRRGDVEMRQRDQLVLLA
jgi:adenylate cyclase